MCSTASFSLFLFLSHFLSPSLSFSPISSLPLFLFLSHSLSFSHSLSLLPSLFLSLSLTGTVCSGNGGCSYSDPSGNEIPVCDISNTRCKAVCQCRVGYGGKDCSMKLAMLTARSSIRCVTSTSTLMYSYCCTRHLTSTYLQSHHMYHRATLCQALVTAYKLQDKSSSLLETTASSLLTSFSPHEVTSALGTPSCTAAVLIVASLSRKGFLEIEQNSQLVVDLISDYALLTNVTAIEGSPVKQRNVDTAVRQDSM